jgi:hypothetical protein
VLGKKAREQHSDARVRQIRKETDKTDYASSVKPPASTSIEVILVGSVKILTVARPSRKPPEEEKLGVRKEKLSSEVTRRDVVTRDVTRRGVGLRGLKAGTKRTQLEAGCSRRYTSNVQITEDKQAKMRFHTFKKGGSEQKEKKKTL